MTVATRKRKPAEEGGAVFDRELDDLPQELRWREWMGRVEAVLFASASPVGRDELARPKEIGAIWPRKNGKAGRVARGRRGGVCEGMCGCCLHLGHARLRWR